MSFITEGEIQGGFGYGRQDSFPSESYYHDSFSLLGNGGTTYIGNKMSSIDPYLPILNEPMGYGFAEKNFESSLDTASRYRYNPAPRTEERYYPASMLNDSRVDMQYERMTADPDATAAPDWTDMLGAWAPTYNEMTVLVILLVIIMIVVSMIQGRRVSKLKKKVEKLQGTPPAPPAATSVTPGK